MKLRLIVTRPAAQAANWVDALRAAGLDAQALPLIEIAAPADSEPVRAAWAALARQALVMFVSANAVQHFFALRPEGAVWPAGVLAGSTGPGTTAALRAAGVREVAEPDPAAGRFDSEALWQALSGRSWADCQVLIVRGEEGRDWLAETLRAVGAKVDFVAAYTRRLPQPDAAGQALLHAAQAAPQAHLWLFSSSEAVGNLGTLCPGADWSAGRALASHPRIAEAARRCGFAQVGSLPATPPALAQALAEGGPLQSFAL